MDIEGMTEIEVNNIKNNSNDFNNQYNGNSEISGVNTDNISNTINMVEEALAKLKKVKVSSTRLKAAKEITSNIKSASVLPEIMPHLWKRYNFKSKSRYYMIILQQDIFHEWSITKVYGGNNNKLGNFMIESCKSYQDALEKIKEIKKTRKSHKYVLKRK